MGWVKGCHLTALLVTSSTSSVTFSLSPSLAPAPSAPGTGLVYFPWAGFLKGEPGFPGT